MFSIKFCRNLQYRSVISSLGAVRTPNNPQLFSTEGDDPRQPSNIFSEAFFLVPFFLQQSWGKNSSPGIVEYTTSLITLFTKIDIFWFFKVNSSALIPNLLELFFSDNWIRFYRIRKASCQKKTFLKIIFVKQNFWGFIAFFYNSI